MRNRKVSADAVAVAVTVLQTGLLSRFEVGHIDDTLLAKHLLRCSTCGSQLDSCGMHLNCGGTNA